MSSLFSTLKLKDMKLKNRIVMAPMCMYSANVDGFVNDWHITHYGTRAIGGVGLIILEATGVEGRGRISNNDLGIWKDEHIEGLKKVVDICHGNGSKIGIQLAHAGRKSEVTSEQAIAPSAIAFSDEYSVPIEMTLDDINTVISSFKEGARRALLAGFDIIEIHGAHGYLINEFLSPLTNKREDKYGGSIENRARFLKEIIKSVREVWPKEKPLGLRVSAEEYSEGGNHVQDLAEVVRIVKSEGVDIVDVSSGGVINVGPKAYPGYQVTYAETIKREAAIEVMAGGLITNYLMAEEIIQNERAELVFLGRELLRNPYWALHAAKALNSDQQWPAQYQRAR